MLGNIEFLQWRDVFAQRRSRKYRRHSPAVSPTALRGAKAALLKATSAVHPSAGTARPTQGGKPCARSVISLAARRWRAPPAAAATSSIRTPARCRPRSPSPANRKSNAPSPMPKPPQPAWAATNPQRRARVLFKFLELVQKEFDSLARAAVLRARQDHRRCQGRHPARARSGRVRLRHSAPAERRVQRQRRPRHRSVLAAPAARAWSPASRRSTSRP